MNSDNNSIASEVSAFPENTEIANEGDGLSIISENDSFGAILDQYRQEAGVKAKKAPKAPKVPRVLLTPEEKRQRKNDAQNEKNRAKEEAKLQKEMTRPAKAARSAKASDQGEDETGIIGLEKRLLLHKIQQYKTLFPAQCKAFRVDKKATAEVLKQCVQELSDIVSISSMDGFVISGILESVEQAEKFTVYTRFNISGLAKKLREDDRFDCLAKQLFIKYNVFSNIPLEAKMLFLVFIAASTCKAENDALRSRA